MSIILAQKAIQAVLQVGLKQIQSNKVIRDKFLSNYADFDATFRQFNAYAAVYNIKLENYVEPIAEIEKFLTKTEFHIALGYPRLHASLPEICVVLGNDGEDGGNIGDIADETRDENGNQKILWSSNKQKSFNIYLVDNNPDSVEMLHHAIDYILVTHRTLLAQMGLNSCRFDASDIHPSQEGLSSGTFLFERVITVACDVYQTYETSFYGYSPMPTEVAMSSELIEEGNVDIGDLEDEVEIEPTPAIVEDDLYYVGDQIPKDSSMEMLFRGVTEESTMTEEVVKGLEFANFEQQIVGEWMFEPTQEYIVTAYPKILGELLFEIGGSSATFFRQEMTINNTEDEPVEYFVYRSEITYSGTIILTTTKI